MCSQSRLALQFATTMTKKKQKNKIVLIYKRSNKLYFTTKVFDLWLEGVPRLSWASFITVYSQLCSCKNLHFIIITSLNLKTTISWSVFWEWQFSRKFRVLIACSLRSWRDAWAGERRLFTNPLTASPLAFTASLPKQKHSRTKSRQLRRLIAWKSKRTD